MPVHRLKKRSDFKRVAAFSCKVVAPAFVISCAPHIPSDLEARLGFVVTKKIGNAVIRNRVKRRLRALAITQLGQYGLNLDYVVIARPEAQHAPFSQLSELFQKKIFQLHQRYQKTTH
jgi:ribonuclease P protein component